MQEVIQVLAYTKKETECPKCRGKKYIVTKDKKIVHKNGGLEEIRETTPCNCGSGTKVFLSIVVRRFEKCPLTKTNVNECIASQKDFKICNEYNSKCIKEQTFKVGSKYKFALNKVNCKNCYCTNENGFCTKLLAIGFTEKETLQKQEKRCSKLCFEPRIIEGVVRKEGIPFTFQESHCVELYRGMKNSGCLDLAKYDEIEKFMTKNGLDDGEYLLLPKVEIIK